MREKAKENRIWAVRAVCLVAILTIAAAELVSGLSARFAAGGSGGDSARVAAFAFSTQDGAGSHSFDLSNIQKPGDRATYTFTVSNKDGSTVSEVAENIKFTVQLNGSMPLTCTVSKQGAEAPVLTANITGSTKSLPVTASGAGDGFAASAERTDTYTLTVQWPPEENDVKYASRSAAAEVILTITAEQAD